MRSQRATRQQGGIRGPLPRPAAVLRRYRVVAGALLMAAAIAGTFVLIGARGRSVPLATTGHISTLKPTPRGAAQPAGTQFPAASEVTLDPRRWGSVRVTWQEPTSRTPARYQVQGSVHGRVTSTQTVTTTSAQLEFGIHSKAQPVTVTVTAVYPGGRSAASTAHGVVAGSVCTHPPSLRRPDPALARAALPACQDLDR